METKLGSTKRAKQVGLFSHETQSNFTKSFTRKPVKKNTRKSLA